MGTEYSRYLVGLAAFILVAILVAGIVISPKIFAVLAIIVILLGLLTLATRPQKMILLLCILLPCNTLLDLILFDGMGNSPVLHYFELWKDVILFGSLLTWITIRLMHEKKVHVNGRASVVVAVALLCLETMYTVLPMGPSGFIGRAYAFRTDMWFVLFLILGLLVDARQINVTQVMRVMLCVTLVFCSIGMVERFINPVHILVAIGLPDYSSQVLHQSYLTYSGLPYTYWNGTGTRRIGSLALNPLDLAALCIFTLPIAFNVRRAYLSILAVLLIILTVIFTLSRTDIVIVLLEALILSYVGYPRIRKAVAMLALTAFLCFIAGVFLDNKLSRYVMNTITFKEPSAQGHLHMWLLAVHAVIAHPFGVGLATAGEAGQRFGNVMGGENQYLIFGVEMGWLAIALFVAFLVLIIRDIGRSNNTIAHKIWIVSTITYLAISGLTQQSFINITITSVTFFIAGVLLQRGMKVGAEGSNCRTQLEFL